MYELSRYLFRALRPELPRDHAARDAARTLIGLCEETVGRIAPNPHAAAFHASHLFSRIRWLFPVDRHREISMLVDRAVARVAEELIARDRPAGAMRCQAITVHSAQCRNRAVEGSLYCAPHQRRQVGTPRRRVFAA